MAAIVTYSKYKAGCVCLCIVARTRVPESFHLQVVRVFNEEK